MFKLKVSGRESRIFSVI